MAYGPPTPSKPPETTVSVDSSFDETWSALIELLTVSFADIELLDRDSGFIRIDFSGDATTYVDCGRIRNAPNPWGIGGGWLGDPVYSGPYSFWLEENGGFRGRINIRAVEIDDARTEVQVHARYVLGSHVLETGQTSTRNVGFNRTRTCQPTYVAESAILGTFVE